MVKNKEYHYFYKITNLINEHYYYGIHSTNNLNDGYMGSGVRLNKAYKKYGIENFTKEILKFFNSRKEASDYEAEVVTETLIRKDDCYNMIVGGENFTTKDKVIIYDEENEKYKIIPKDYYVKELYKTPCTSKISVLNVKNGNYEKVSIQEFKEQPDLYMPVNKNKVTVKDNRGNFYLVSVNDERYINGDLVHVWKDRKHKEETKVKLKETLQKIHHQQGEKNSQYGTCWVYNEKGNLKIKKEEFEEYLNKGYKKGRVQKNYLYEDKDVKNIKNLRNEGYSWNRVSALLNIPKSSLFRLKYKYDIN